MTNQITIGDVFERLKTEFFPSPSTKLETLCRERELGLKQYIQISQQMIHDHMEYRSGFKDKLIYWKNDRIETHIKNLCEYIELLAFELEKIKIEGHCKNNNIPSFLPFEPDYTFLMNNSLHGSIISDLMWAGDITVADAVKLSNGKLKLQSLQKYLPDKMKMIKEQIIPYLKKSRYKRHVSSINEVLLCQQHNLHLASNLLLMTTIEGMVRDLAEYLNNKQNLNHNLRHEKFNSLDSLLRKGNWKKDYQITETELQILTQSKPPLVMNYSLPIDFRKLGFSVPSNLNEWKEFKGIGNHKIKINLKTRLDFLRRRFKDDRDLIFHGQKSEYGTNWYLFVNFSSLSQVFETLKYYDLLYD